MGRQIGESAQQLSPEYQAEQKAVLANLIGMQVSNLDFTIYTDALAMIKNDQRERLDGYIYCLSRIISHEVALTQIQRAYKDVGESIPKYYLQLFNLDPPPMPKGGGRVSF